MGKSSSSGSTTSSATLAGWISCRTGTSTSSLEQPRTMPRFCSAPLACGIGSRVPSGSLMCGCLTRIFTKWSTGPGAIRVSSLVSGRT
ncbi:hypothetical protein HPP92_006092 [Vanilla planifolia]|uniref:Uncharacterized protein n=1 Tax=Vanilla planifolia TaxID=51239 RepID=A0A835VFC1_VANPL|nr:hypothetical protein HPP92_006092 [Vanilla planifolia]